MQTDLTHKTLAAFLSSPALAVNPYREHNDLEFKLIRLFAECGCLDRSLSLKLVSYINPTFDGKMLSIYINAKDAERNRRTIGKPAKLIRKLDPTISESDLEAFSVWFKDCTLANDGLILKTATDADTFASVYKMDQAAKSDPNLGHDRKSLSASCMRYDFSHLPYHPAYIYGSGDFTLGWIENSQGQLAARVVVCTRINKDGLKCFVPAPIYTNSNVAADMLDTWIDQEKAKATDQEKHTWLNAKLLRIETDDGLLAPYFDRDSSVKDNGDFLVVSRLGDIELSSTHGTVSDYEYHCSCCGQGLNEYDTFWGNDEVYCDSCFTDTFTYCDNCEEYDINENITIVEGHGSICSGCVSCDPDFVQSHDGEIYHIDDCVWIESDSEFYPLSYEGKAWFTSDIDGEPYSINDQAKLPLWFPDVMTRDQAIESGHWTLTTKIETVWYQPRTRNFGLSDGLGYYTTNVIETWELKPWLEWNGYEIVNNQLDLFEDA